MNAVIAAAGIGRRMEADTDKPLLSVGSENLIGHAVRSLVQVGCQRFEVVCNDGNVVSMRQYLISRFPDLTFGFPLQPVATGTADAVVRGLARVHGPCWVSWCDMVVRIPTPTQTNMIVVAAVDPSESSRYEQVRWGPEGRVTEIVPRRPMLAPVFGAVGVFYLTDAAMFRGMEVSLDATGQMPFERLIDQALRAGQTFTARAAIGFVDFGVRASYDLNRIVFRDVLGEAVDR